MHYFSHSSTHQGKNFSSKPKASMHRKMAFLVLILLMVSCSRAALIPMQTDCSLHKHVESLYDLRSKGSCDHLFNGQQLSPALCQASSLVSYEAVDAGHLGNCIITFSTTINTGESFYGGHLAIYMNNEDQNQTPQLEPTLSVILTDHTLGNVSNRSIPTLSSSGWQIFNVDPVLRGLSPGTHKIILELTAFWKEQGPMTCDDVGRTFLLYPSVGRRSKARLENNPNSACLRPVLTGYSNGSLRVVSSSTPHTTNTSISRSSGRGHARREVRSSSSIHDYVLQLFKKIPSFRKLRCNATFNEQQVLADLCLSDHVKTFKQLNNSCVSDGWTVAFNISLNEEVVLGAQLVLYLNRSAANSTDPLLILVHQGDTLLTEKTVPPSHDGWQLLDIKPSTQQWSDGWDVPSFTIRMFRGGGGSGEHLVPIECWEFPDWIILGAAEGSDDAGDESDTLFAPIFTLFANYVSVCRQPWPWLCLGQNGFVPFGRRSIEINSGTTANNNNNNKSNWMCSIEDKWVPSSHLTAGLQSVSSNVTPYNSIGVVVLPKSLNVRRCASQCSSGLFSEGSNGGRGLGTCCGPERYGRAHMVMKRTDSSYLVTSLDSAIVENCGPVD